MTVELLKIPEGYDPFDGSHRPGIAAEAYAALLRWRVIPLWWPANGGCACPHGAQCSSPGKHPIIPNWPKTAASDRLTVRRWWTRWPRANVGIATGRASGFVVLDADPRHGSEGSLEALVAEYGPLPDGPVSLTGGGGQHVLFAPPPGGIGNAVDLAPGLDFRGEGGLIVAPPSVHASGQRYMWELSGHPLDVALPPLPAWIADRVRRPVHAGSGVAAETDPAWLAAVIVGRIAEGGRNDTLARLYGHLLRRRVDARLAAAIISAVNGAFGDPPLDASEVQSIARSIAARELARRGGGQHG